MAISKLKLAYSIRELTRDTNSGWDPRKMRRVLKAGGVEPREDGKIWLCDIRDHMPQFYESWIELSHQQDLAKIRSRIPEEIDA